MDWKLKTFLVIVILLNLLCVVLHLGLALGILH